MPFLQRRVKPERACKDLRDGSLKLVWRLPLHELQGVCSTSAGQDLKYVVRRGTLTPTPKPARESQVFSHADNLPTGHCKLRICRTDTRKSLLDIVGSEMSHDVCEWSSCANRRQLPRVPHKNQSMHTAQ